MSGEAHPAAGGLEQLTIPTRRDLQRAGARRVQGQPGHVMAEAAVAVMVLAVDVTGDRPPTVT